MKTLTKILGLKKHLDVVLDENMIPLFNGTPKEIMKYLKENPGEKNRWVSIGRSLRIMTIAEYSK